MKKKERDLNHAWAVRQKLRHKSMKLFCYGAMDFVEYLKLFLDDRLRRAEDYKIWIEHYKKKAQCDLLISEGEKCWADAIIKAHGNIKYEWKYVSAKADYSCILATGQVFQP